MKFCTKELSRPHGVKHCSNCFPKLTVLASQLIFGPLQTYAYCTKSLPIWCLVGLRRRWEQHQPEEQHGFRSGRRIEEHLLTANIVIDKTLLANVPLWIVSLDLSKALDRVSWDSLWGGLLRHGVSRHLVWALRLIYWEQKGQIITKQDTSREFDIKAGVRQGCVLSPRLFSCVLEVALKKWREQLQDGGLDFGDGGIPLLDLRFADDILLFATSSVEAARMVDALVTCLKEVGLALNASKTKILTTQAQPGKTVTTQNGLEMEILDATTAHKWLGCLLSTLNAGNREADLGLPTAGYIKGLLCEQVDFV